MQAKPLVGISACLCGDRVRYDGREKGLPDLIQALKKQLTLLKVCPEVAIGMGVPRPPIQLTLHQGNVEARGVNNPSDHVTPALQDYAQSLINHHASFNPSNGVLCGFIFKSRSPSCGAGSTPIYKNNRQVDLGSGIFAQQLQQQLPWLPIAEEDALLESRQQLDFVMQNKLVQLFWQTILDETNGKVTFHKKISPLLEIFPAGTKSELERQTSDSSSSSSQQYLTQLMNVLKTTQKQD